LMVFWFSIGNLPQQAITITSSMAFQCKNIAGQVRTMCNEWSAYTEPVLYSPAIHEDSLECSSWMDWIRQTVFPNEPVESVEFLYAGTRLKITSHLLRINLLYLCWCRQPSYHSWWKI
jgi:hypothetical protein